MTDLTADDPQAPSLPPKQWRHRRRMIYGALIFIALSLTYLMLLGNDESRLHETLAFGLMTGGFGIISSYVFGAIWDDKNLLALKR